MATPNLFLIYVANAAAATQFYRRLFELTPHLETPNYVDFEIAPGVHFALWSGAREDVDLTAQRTSEVGLMIEGGPQAVDALFTQWTELGAAVVSSPEDKIFGRTFVVADPDGNLIRVSPVD